MGLSRLTYTTLVFGAGVVGVLIYKWHQRRAKNRMPIKWRRVGELTELTLYPVKSGKAVHLQLGECTDLGLKTTDDHPLRLRDRFFMVFNEKAESMVTARQYPSMVLIGVTSADEDAVTFEAPNMPELRVKLPIDSTKKILKMWMGEKVHGLDCGDSAAEWLCTYILKGKSGLRLAYYRPEVNPRRDFSIRPWDVYQRCYKNLRADDSGAFSDLAPFMLMSEDSVADIRSRVSPRLPSLSSRWFRPNLLVRGAEPFAEDDWDWVRVGDEVVFRFVKPCTRCVFTTINPETGIKDSAMEPLRTLKKYRQISDPASRKLEGDAPLMGINLGLRRAGIVRVGDPVYVGL